MAYTHPLQIRKSLFVRSYFCVHYAYFDKHTTVRKDELETQSNGCGGAADLDFIKSGSAPMYWNKIKMPSLTINNRT